MTRQLAPEQMARRSHDRCPDCGVRAMTGYIGAMQLTCQSCGKVTPLSEPVPAPDDRPLPQPTPMEHVVYYLRFADRVKIGTTRDIKQRMQSIPYDELLATEPGSYDLEKRRHRQFHASRIYINREWFHLTDDLRQHIARLSV